MNVLSLYNRALLNNNEVANDRLRDLNGTSNILPKEEKNDISFKDFVNEEIEKVNASQVKADTLTNQFMTGEIEDLHSVMIATEEARISLELAVQVRNKCIEAFKEINNMQL